MKPAPLIVRKRWYRDDNTEMWYVPDSSRNLLRADLKTIWHRIEYYMAGDNETRIKNSLEQQILFPFIWTGLQSFHMIWITAWRVSRLVPSLNPMMDILSPWVSPEANVSGMILFVLCVLILVSCFSFRLWQQKSGKEQKYWCLRLHSLRHLPYTGSGWTKPRQGFVNLGSTEQLLVNLRNLFTENKWQLIIVRGNCRKTFTTEIKCGQWINPVHEHIEENVEFTGNPLCQESIYMSVDFIKRLVLSTLDRYYAKQNEDLVDAPDLKETRQCQSR